MVQNLNVEVDERLLIDSKKKALDLQMTLKKFVTEALKKAVKEIKK